MSSYSQKTPKQNSLWVFPGKAAEFFNVKTTTIVKWADSGKIPSRLTVTGRRQVYIGSDSGPISNDPKQSFCYARVSSAKQRDDLERQKSFLHSLFPEHQIITDIGSGINYHRKGLLTLLERIENDTVSEIVVASKDRLCRFGFELIEWLCSKHGVKIVVLEQTNTSPEEELSSELLDIVQVFCCRRNGKRRYHTQQLEAPFEIQPTTKENTSDMGTG